MKDEPITWRGARFAVACGNTISNPDTLRLVGGKHGRTIAHYAARAGQIITDPAILALADPLGVTVADLAKEFEAELTAFIASEGSLDEPQYVECTQVSALIPTESAQALATWVDDHGGLIM